MVNNHDKTLAPTSQTTLDKLEQDKNKFTELEYDFVTLVKQHYYLTGDLLNTAVAEAEYYITPDEFEKCMSNEKVREVLIAEGIDFRRYVFDSFSDNPAPVGNQDGNESNTNNWRAVGLTGQQLTAANKVLDFLDSRSERKKLQDLGITSSTWQAWLKQPAFSGYLKDRAESLIGVSQHDAHLALLYKVRSGDLNSIKYYNELTGRFTQSADKQSGASAFDTVQLVNSIVEIIVDEADGPTAVRIAERLKALMTTRAITEELVNPNTAIEQPTIAPARKMTPEIEKAMEQGVGIDT